MPKSLLKIVFLILFSVLAMAAYFLLISPGLSREAVYEEAVNAGTEEKLVSGSPAELEDVLLLEELVAKPFPENEEGLLLLSERKDAVGYKAGLELARAYAGKGQEARELYRKALALYETKNVQKELAAHLEEINLQEEAREKYFQVLPDSEAQEALLDLEVTHREIGRFLYDNSHFRELVNFLAPYLDHEPAAGELKYFYAAGLVHTGNYGEALPLLEDLIEEAEGDVDVSRLKWYYARSLEAAGETAKALSIYEEIGQAGNYRRGIILNARGNKNEAAEAFSSAPEQAGRWWGARLWEELGQPYEALPLYMQLVREEGYLKDDAAYRAYLLLSRDEDPRAGEFLEYLATEPAWMARLGKEPRWETEEPLPETNPAFISRAEVYRDSGRDELASLEMAIGEIHASPAELLALGRWHLQQADYFKTVRLGIELLREHPCRASYQLAFPRPYREVVEKAAADYQLDPHLLWAVMREESHFRPAVISAADARGLMQIMPSTGQDIAERKGIEISLEDLFNPELNIRFGAWYLRAMLDSFEGDPDKALAAYNAGSGNARRWSRSPLGEEPGGFPTAITYRETRQYITRVMNSYLTYGWLYE